MAVTIDRVLVWRTFVTEPKQRLVEKNINDVDPARDRGAAFCPVCKELVRLHLGEGVEPHAEHAKRTGKCPLES